MQKSLRVLAKQLFCFTKVLNGVVKRLKNFFPKGGAPPFSEGGVVTLDVIAHISVTLAQSTQRRTSEVRVHCRHGFHNLETTFKIELRRSVKLAQIFHDDGAGSEANAVARGHADGHDAREIFVKDTFRVVEIKMLAHIA